MISDVEAVNRTWHALLSNVACGRRSTVADVTVKALRGHRRVQTAAIHAIRDPGTWSWRWGRLTEVHVHQAVQADCHWTSSFR